MSRPDKLFTEKQYARIKKENGLVSYDGTNLKDADGNTIEVGGGGELTIEELWKNASPTTFNSQDIEINELSNYKYVYVLYKAYGYESEIQTNYLLDIQHSIENYGVTNYQIKNCYAITCTIYSFYYRTIYYKKDNNNKEYLSFGDGYLRNFSDITSQTANGSSMVPTIIYGIK